MKNFKPSKFLLFSFGILTLIGSIVIGKADAASNTRYNRSVQDMMARRHNLTTNPAHMRSMAQPRQSYAPVSYQGASYNIPPYELSQYNMSMAPYNDSYGTNYANTSIMATSSKDGSLFPGGGCKNCHKSGPLIDTGPCERCYNTGPLFDTGPCERCYENGPLFYTGPCEKCSAPKPEPTCSACAAPVETCCTPKPATYAIAYNDYVAQAVSRDCCAMAPLYLEHVDFNLKGDSSVRQNKMGNYRFRIFGCRRYNKEAILNQGRLMEKDMNFTKVFESTTSDCYRIVKKPDDLCLQTTPSPLPEYILTAEVTDFYMNVCDGYNWESAKKSDKRTGSSEMTVKWRLTNLSKTKVLWEGETTGYADLNVGEERGEIALVEAAFADAVTALQTAKGFEDQLMVRLSPEELGLERQALIDEERALNPAKCRYAEPLHKSKQCQITRPESNIMECPAVEVKPFDNCLDVDGNVIVGGDCMVVDDTWVETEVQTFDDLCITARAPYEVLTPENLYKVRASVVEISNNNGQKGAGLIVSDTFVLTSASLVDNNENVYKVRTINGKEFSARAVRVNPSKNIALLTLDTPTEYTPLALNLDLPTVGATGYMTLGLLDVEAFDNGTENYIDNNGTVLGYRYSEDKGSEIIVDTKIQDLTIGSVLIDSHGSVDGVAHTGFKTEDGQDLFLPTETVLRSVGLQICDCVYEAPSPWQQTIYKPVTELILHSEPKAPEVMEKKDRK